MECNQTPAAGPGSPPDGVLTVPLKADGELRVAAKDLRRWADLVGRHTSIPWQTDWIRRTADLLEQTAERHRWQDYPNGDAGDWTTVCVGCGHMPSAPDVDLCPDMLAALAVARAFMGGAG